MLSLRRNFDRNMNSFVSKLMFLCSFLLIGEYCISQKTDSTWTIIWEESSSNKITKTTENKSLADSIIQTLYSDIVGQGFLDAQLDTIESQHSIFVKIEKGQAYCVGENKFSGNVDLTNFVQRKTAQNGENLSPSTIEKSPKIVLEYLQNVGYPFAQIRLLQIANTNENGCYDIDWAIDKGPLIKIDSLVIRSNEKVPSKYIENYCDLDPGEVYDESKLKALNLKLQEIAFLKILRAPEVLFHENKATVYIFCERKKSNYFNGVVGIRPDENSDKVNITGDVEIKLQNALNKGEDINLNWKRLQAQTQDLSVNTRIPFLFSMPVGVDGLLKIYRRDTTFSSTKANAGLLIPIGGSDYLKVFVEKNTTNRLSNLTALTLKDVNSTIYGLSISRSNLDYKFNPSKGYSIEIEGGVGKRKILADSFDNSTTVSNPTYRVEANFNVYLPLFKKQSIHLGIGGSSLITDNIYTNELTRIGGLRTIRGIDEESIFASTYTVSTLEYRFIPELNTALYLFVDQAWYEQKSTDAFVTDTPRGFGVGANFETKAGIFTFNYALGQQFDNPILIRNAKISFGFKNIF